MKTLEKKTGILAERRTFKPGSWTPRRRGDIYCAPACGRGCKWAEYQEALEKSRILAMACGAGWKGSVSENLGWHYGAVSPCGRISVSASHYPGHTPTYGAYLGQPTSGTYWTSEYMKDPRKAIRDVLKQAKDEIAAKTKFLEGL